MEGSPRSIPGEGDYDRLRSKPKHEPLEYLDRLYFSVRTTEASFGVLIDAMVIRLGRWNGLSSRRHHGKLAQHVP